MINKLPGYCGASKREQEGNERGKRNSNVFVLEIDFFFQDYKLQSGDSIVRFSCVGINLAQSNDILETNIAIDSAIVGMTANVFVNGSAYVCYLILF